MVEGDGRTIAFLDRDTLAIGGSRDLRILDVKEGAVSVYPGHGVRISSVASAPEKGLFFSADEAGEVDVWTRTSGNRGLWSWKQLRTATSRPVKKLFWQGSGELEIEEYGSSENSLEVIHVGSEGFSSARFSSRATDQLRSRCQDAHPAGTRWKSTAGTSDGLWFAYTTEANEIVVEDRKSGACLQPLFGLTLNVLDMAFRDDGLAVASAGAVANADDTHGVIVWDLAQVHPLAQRLTPVNSRHAGIDSKLSVSRDGSSWACGNCGENIRWDGLPVILPSEFALQSVASVAVSPDGLELALASNDGKLIRVVRSGNRFRFEPLASGSPAAKQLWYGGDDLFSVGQDGSVVRWVGRKSKVVLAQGGKRAESSCPDSFSTGAHVAFETRNGSGRALISLVNLLTGASRTVQLPPNAGNCSSLSYAGERGNAIRLTSGYEPMYLLSLSRTIDIKPWENPVHANSGLRTVLDMARISDDGKRLVAVSNRSSLVLFDLQSQRLIGVLDIPELSSIAMSGDGKRVLTFGGTGLLMWNLDSTTWADMAIKIAGRRR
jgi:WD40 repeat protein